MNVSVFCVWSPRDASQKADCISLPIPWVNPNLPILPMFCIAESPVRDRLSGFPMEHFDLLVAFSNAEKKSSANIKPI